MRELIKQIVQFLRRRPGATDGAGSAMARMPFFRRPIDVEIENNRAELMRERIERGHRV